MIALVPSPGWEDALTALDQVMNGKRAISAAVAFVSRAGVSALSDLLKRHPSIEEIQIVARGAPITDPDALLMLRDELGASVAVVTGAAALSFHPKLWLIEGDGILHVVSGSGNLTAGGLSGNREQFEVLEISDKNGIEEQWARFGALTREAITLEELDGSIAWREWKRQTQRRAWLAREQAALDQRLASSPAKNMEQAKQALERDLWEIHDRTLREKLPKPEGGTYNPSGFRLEIEGHRGATDPVHVVGRLCRRQTKGFDVIKESGLWELTVESLVVDPNKPYYELFKGDIRNRSEERLRQFPNWSGPPSKR